MKKLSAANEIAHAMKDFLSEKPSCPTTPDKITEALEHLGKAAQLLDTVGKRAAANRIDQLIQKFATLELESPKKNMQELAKGKADQGDWLPANDGTEVPFVTRTGRRLLYCWQPSTGNHAYIDLDSDLILSDEEAIAALAL